MFYEKAQDVASSFEKGLLTEGRSGAQTEQFVSDEGWN